MSTPKREKRQIVTLPTTRISSIMKSTPDVSSVSADSIIVAARAAELFIAHLARRGMAISVNGKSLDYHHLSSIVADDPRLEFLRDMVPPKMKIHEYQEILAKVEERERELGRTVLGSEVKGSQAEEEEEEEEDEVEEVDGETDERAEGDTNEAEVDEEDENEAQVEDDEEVEDSEQDEEVEENENADEDEQVEEEDDEEPEEEEEEEDDDDDEEEEEEADSEEIVELSDSDS